MPSRIIKESICTSEDIALLSPLAEILFYRLIVKADDYGAYYGNESIVRNSCFPLVSEKKISAAKVDSLLQELVSANLVIRYLAEDGRKYLQLTKWDKHQQIRAKKRKFPAYDSNCNQLITDDIKCNQLNTNVTVIQSNPIQSKSESNSLFKPPTLEEVSAYCMERNNNIQAQHFIDYYSARNWMLGKVKMKDWKAAVRTWERNDSTPKSEPKTKMKLSDLKKVADSI